MCLDNVTTPTFLQQHLVVDPGTCPLPEGGGVPRKSHCLNIVIMTFRALSSQHSLIQCHNRSQIVSRDRDVIGLRRKGPDLIMNYRTIHKHIKPQRSPRESMVSVMRQIKGCHICVDNRVVQISKQSILKSVKCV